MTIYRHYTEKKKIILKADLEMSLEIKQRISDFDEKLRKEQILHGKTVRDLSQNTMYDLDFYI